MASALPSDGRKSVASGRQPRSLLTVTSSASVHNWIRSSSSGVVRAVESGTRGYMTP
jgi:hypothetical protein